MTESIVVVRLTRNLRYKLTYVKIFEKYLESERNQKVINLLRTLLQAQQTAIAPLSSYLRRMDVNTQELPLDDKLMSHAFTREDTHSRLRFIYDGLDRASSWYKMQLVDKQMTADPELEELMFELGEIDAAKLWRVEAVMNILKMPVKLKTKEYEEQAAPEPERREGWQPRLVEDVSRPGWSSGRFDSRWQKPSRPRRGER
jgi:hypothetical protein